MQRRKKRDEVAMVNLVVRIEPEINDRLERLEQALEPKIRSILGSRIRLRSGVLRAILERGIDSLERENTPIEQQVAFEDDVKRRIERIEKQLGPRIRSLTGKSPSREQIIEVLIDRGATQVEREFGLNESDVDHILVDLDSKDI